MKSGSQEVEIRSASRSLLRVFGEPVTWVPFLPIAAAYSFLDVPWLACAGAAAAVAAGLTVWWRAKWPSLRAASRIDVLRELCTADNADMQASLAPLIKQIDPAVFGMDGDARSATLSSLRNFTKKKQAIDDAIFADDDVTSIEMEIAVMVSDLCRAMLGDLRKLAGTRLSDAEQARLAASVASALKAMERTNNEIETLLEPAHGLESSLGASTAEERAARLEERLTEARAIRRRLQRDMAGPDIEVPPASPEMRQS